MTNTTRARLLFAAVLMAVAGAAPAAWAQTCSADTDCPSGFSCVVSGTATPACKGADCPADAAAADPIIYRACEPKACTTDAECGTGMVCYEQTSTTCVGSGGTSSGCAANTTCDAGTVVTSVETCTATTRKICAFKWQLPCSADSDCGDGFVCQPTVSGGCGTSTRSGSSTPGGSGGATGSGDSSPPAADGGAAQCPTTTSYPGSCAPKATTCSSDGECPSGWTCTAIGTPAPVTGIGQPIAVSADASSTPPADSLDAGGAQTKICIGPFGAGAPTRGTVGVGTGGETTSGHEGSDTSVPPASGGTSATGGTTGGGQPGSDQVSSGSSGGGCAVAPARGAHSSLLLLGLVIGGLVLARRRLRK